MTHHFKDSKCLEHDGVDSVDKRACCPAKCGEFCGAKFCKDYNPVGNDGMETSECCIQDYEVQCAPGVKAPCMIDDPKLTYEPYDYTVDSKIAGPKTMTERPIFTGHLKALVWYKLSEANPYPLPPWCTFSVTSGVLTCDLEKSGYEHVPKEKFWFGVEASDGSKLIVKSKVFVPFANPPVKLSYKIPHSLPEISGLGQKKLYPHVECAWPGEVEECDPEYTVKPTMPLGITFDFSKGTIAGDMAMLPIGAKQKYIVTAEGFGQIVSFEFSVPEGLNPPLISYKLPTEFASNQTVKLLAADKGGPSTQYVVQPILPVGFSLNASTGEVKGTLGCIGNREQTYTITATNPSGSDSSQIVLPMPLLPPVGLNYTGFPPAFQTNETLNLLAHNAGGAVTLYKIEPEVKHFIFSSTTGTLHGRIPNMERVHMVNYTLTAENCAGVAKYVFALPQAVPRVMGLDYKQPYRENFAKALLLPPIVTGPKPTIYVVEPALPAVLKLDSKTGVVYGTIKRPTKEAYEYTITGITPHGNTTATLKLPKSQPAPFPWWTFVVIVLIALLCWYFRPVKKEERIIYTKLEAAPPVPVTATLSTMETQTVAEPPPPPEFPIVFDTPDGEKTVYATKKPLGLEYPKQIPITISEDREGHGRELGVKLGWIMRKINGKDLTGCKSFQEARHIMYEEAQHLPGGVTLTFTKEDKLEKKVWATKTPLGIEWSRNVPVAVEQVLEGQHAQELEIQTGWILKAVNKETCYGKEYNQVNAILEAAMGNLKGLAVITSSKSGL
jgi:hypothetical protein